MNTSRTRLTVTLTLASVVAAGGVGASAANAVDSQAEAALAPAKLRIVQHNTDQKLGAWNDVVAKVKTKDWDAVLVQEVCSGWVTKLQAAHPTWTINYHKQQDQSTCLGGHKGNVAIHVGAAQEWKKSYVVAGGKDFNLTCVVFNKAGRRVHACSTHLAVYGDNPVAVRLAQAKEIKGFTKPWIDSGHSVLVGGDLNAKSEDAALDPLFRYPTATSSGRFVEGNQLAKRSQARIGAVTTDGGRRIDHVFFSANRTPLSVGGTQSTENTTSGHKLLKVTTTIR